MAKINATDVYKICEATYGTIDKVDYEKITFMGNEAVLLPPTECMYGTFLTNQMDKILRFQDTHDSQDPKNGHCVFIADVLFGTIVRFNKNSDYLCITFTLPVETIYIVAMADNGETIVPLEPQTNSAKRFTLFVPTKEHTLPVFHFIAFKPDEDSNEVGVTLAIAF